MKHPLKCVLLKIFATCMFLTVATRASALPVHYSFEIFGIEGEGAMQANDINDNNDIVGTVDSFATGSILPSGFVRRDGSLELIQVPGADRNNGTAAYGINNDGDIVGNFTIRSTQNRIHTHGFLLRDGVLEQIDVAQSSFTGILDISNRGEIAGRTTLNGQNFGTAFTGLDGIVDLYAPDNIRQSFGIAFNGVNDFGNTVGRVLDDNGFGSFAILDGVFTRFTIPGASASSTIARGINNQNQIVGTFSDSAGQHGFLMDLSGIFQIDFPSLTFDDTLILGLNNLGSLVGGVSQPRFPVRQALVATPCQQAGPDCFEMPRISDAVIVFPHLVPAPSTVVLSLAGLLVLICRQPRLVATAGWEKTSLVSQIVDGRRLIWPRLRCWACVKLRWDVIAGSANG